MSQLAYQGNCVKRCPHFAKRRQGALDGPDCPCPQDRQGRLIHPERVRRSMPVDWRCPTLERTGSAGVSPAMDAAESAALPKGGAA